MLSANAPLLFHSYFETTRTPNQDLRDIANYLQEQIQDECAGDEEHTYLILRVPSVFCTTCIIAEMFALDAPSFSFIVMGSVSSMQVIGNMGRTLDNITPTIKSSILRCIGSSKPSMLIQKAAIQALRKMQLGDEVSDPGLGTCEI